MLTVLVDYDSGNLHSAEKAFQRMAVEVSGGAVLVSSHPEDVRRADRIVLPGDGAFPACRAALGSYGGLFEANVVPVDRFRYVSLRAQDIRSVEVREGTSKTGGMIRYGLIGMGVGGLVGALSNGQAVNPTGNDFASGFVVGGIAGAVIGGTLGYLSGKDTWIKVPGPYYLNAPTP